MVPRKYRLLHHFGRGQGARSAAAEAGHLHRLPGRRARAGRKGTGRRCLLQPAAALDSGAVLRPFIGRKAASGSNPLGEYGLLRQAATMVPAAAHPAVRAGAPVGRRYDGMRTHGFDKMVGGRPAAAPGHGDGAARRAGRRPPGARPPADARPVPADAG